ncbi:MAG: trypsin-like peptidase domain-containing protein [Clostridia bacterium]|nr:trypsin-like peptidase domain-containing protein [Clostridia bacterium]
MSAHIGKTIGVLLAAAVAVAAGLSLLSGCAGGGEEKQAVVYEDMKASFDQAGLLSSNIGIFTKTVSGDAVSYGECGSGVIIEKRDGDYYALTAAHVVGAENATLLVFTVNTEMKTDDIPGYEDLNLLSQETYESMVTAEVVFVSSRDDLAVIRFASDEDLAVAELADADPAKGDRILCVGNPQNDWFAVSYGNVTSGIERFGETQDHPSNAMRHSAYIQVGSSGGAAFGEDMKLAGVTPGASLSPDGKTFYYGVLIPVSEIRQCLAEWK